jgi:hypothetical protein
MDKSFIEHSFHSKHRTTVKIAYGYYSVVETILWPGMLYGSVLLFIVEILILIYM